MGTTPLVCFLECPLTCPEPVLGGPGTLFPDAAPARVSDAGDAMEACASCAVGTGVAETTVPSVEPPTKIP